MPHRTCKRHNGTHERIGNRIGILFHVKHSTEPRLSTLWIIRSESFVVKAYALACPEETNHDCFGLNGTFGGARPSQVVAASPRSLRRRRGPAVRLWSRRPTSHLRFASGTNSVNVGPSTRGVVCSDSLQSAQCVITERGVCLKGVVSLSIPLRIDGTPMTIAVEPFAPCVSVSRETAEGMSGPMIANISHSTQNGSQHEGNR